MAGIQKIRLSQIASNMEGVLNFEEQLAKMRSSYEEKFIASNGQKSITLSREYAVGNNQLSVYLNGIRLSLGDDYTETNSRIVTFSEPLLEGDIVLVRIAGDINAVVRNKPGLFKISRESFVITSQNEGQVEFTTSKSFGIVKK